MSTDVTAKKRAGYVLIILGLALLIMALVPGTLVRPTDGMSGIRIVGIVVAALVAAIGFALTRKKGHYHEPPA